ncbi:MAG: 6-phosphogluconolactonase [Marinobacter sp.]|uniref:6-phosphogluconolactonase n=1 Tax=Marinobacter sp. TaxID=50741 RepID=UPI00299E27E6|nr:6-phosphogluconolactonase [Marinobacter sp.]MDX1633701.1 6-phosphogluconolactonase [Marinobacter sp.]
MKTPEIAWPHGVLPVLGEDAEQIAGQLASRIAEALQAVLSREPRASLAVSGGSTPVGLFRALSRKPLDWARVNITLADERWVAEDDPASNTRLVREHLLQGPAAAARFFGLKQPRATAQQGQPDCEQALADLKWPLDVLVLGMGNDGHTASLFPDAPELPRALDPGNPDVTIAVNPPSQAQPRISLTAAALGRARLVFLHIRGEDKLDTLRQALARPEQTAAMPIRLFLRPGLQVFWSP